MREAIASALGQLLDLAARAESDGADILAFQIAMLEDETLAEPAFSAIEVGATADGAWRTALDDQILEYQLSEDEHFRARSSDLLDIRDRVLGALSGAATDSRLPSGAILVGEDLTPSRFLATDWSGGGGIALTRGSASGHVATLARARGVPMIVGLAFDLGGVAQRAEALIDSESATLCLDPEPATREDFAARARAASRSRSAADAFRMRPAVTADGTPIAVFVNIADPAELDALDPACCDGIGLVRTEFLFNQGLPDQETQYRVYRRLAEWAAGKPVTIRTLDAGADKPIPGLTLERGESVPGLARHPAFARQTGGVSDAARGAMSSRRTWRHRGHAAHGHAPRDSNSRAGISSRRWPNCEPRASSAAGPHWASWSKCRRPRSR